MNAVCFIHLYNQFIFYSKSINVEFFYMSAFVLFLSMLLDKSSKIGFSVVHKMVLVVFGLFIVILKQVGHNRFIF
ncbi:hypothetical protein D1614_04395 [Maribellus luteus]|uniref:Uncharacterized protein n=1 Tax=Maribellus luteus TaxID=2305463 RepID=A0A399T0N9_9BACT|nr:hypothetical protein D1614_04395 [Maribellus luteus]